MAGKTGTTDGNKSAWFVGYTPQLSTAVSMFRLDDDETNKNRTFLEMYGTGGQKKIHGASFPAQIWHDYMAEAMKGTPAKDFPEPEPIGEVVERGADADARRRRASETVGEQPSPYAVAQRRPRSTPSPSTSETCNRLDFGCDDESNGGTNNGNGQRRQRRQRR